MSCPQLITTVDLGQGQTAKIEVREADSIEVRFHSILYLRTLCCNETLPRKTGLHKPGIAVLQACFCLSHMAQKLTRRPLNALKAILRDFCSEHSLPAGVKQALCAHLQASLEAILKRVSF